MQMFRREFLKMVGAASVGIPAILRAQNNATIQRKELDMEIKRVGSQPSTKGPADWFTGTVRIDPLFQAKDPARAPAQASRSSLVRERRGTRIRSDRH